MCYHRLSIFMHCGHSTFSDTPVGFCKAARDVSVRLSGSPFWFAFKTAKGINDINDIDYDFEGRQHEFRGTTKA
jgi:hypothetical protein